MDKGKEVQQLVFSDTDEIQEDMPSYSAVPVSDSEDSSEGWVELHSDDGLTSSEEVDESLQTLPVRFFEGFPITALEATEDRDCLASEIAPGCLPDMPSTSYSLAEPSVNHPRFFKREGLEDEEIHPIDNNSGSDVPDFEEIDGKFDTKSVDSEESVEESSQLFAGSPILAENFHSLTSPSPGDASDCTMSATRIKRSCSFQHDLKFMLPYEHNSNKGETEFDGYHAIVSADKAGNCISDTTQDQIAPSGECSDLKPQGKGNFQEGLPSLEGNKAPIVRKRKNLSMCLEDVHDDYMASSKKYNCGKNTHQVEEFVALTVKDSEELEGSLTKGKEKLDNSMDDNQRPMFSTITELNNTINLISAENVNLRAKLSLIHQEAAFSDKVGDMSTGQTLQSLSIRPGMFPYKCNSTAPISRFLLLKGSIRNSNRIKNFQTSADVFDIKKVSGVAAVGLCFIMMLCSPLSWRFTGSQNMKRGDTLLLTAVEDAHVQINARDFSVLITEMEQICKNSSTVDQCILGREPHHSKGMSGEDQIMDHADQQKKSMGKNIMPSSEDILETHVNSSPENSRPTERGKIPWSPALQSVAAIPRNARKPVLISGNYIIPAAVNERTKATSHSAELGLLKKKKGGERSKETQVIKTSRALQDLQSFKKTLLELSKRSIKAKLDPRVIRYAFSIRKAPSFNRKLASTAKCFAKSGASRFTQQWVLGEFAGNINRKLSSTVKSIAKLETSGLTQQWLLQRFAGNTVNAGICTELFRHRIPTLRETHQTNSSAYFQKPMSNKQQCEVDASPLTKQQPAFSLPDADKKLALQVTSESSYSYDMTRGLAEDPSDEQSHQPQKSHSSVAVSVIAGSPFQQAKKSKGVDGSDHVLQLFVVVLVDGVNYVTYSCILPYQLPKSLVTG